VSEDVADARLSARRVKGPDVRVRHRSGGPLALVLEEDLDGAAVERRTALEGAVETPGDRHVGAELVRGPGHRAERSTRRLDPTVGP
jgi:hypothetical protein